VDATFLERVIAAVRSMPGVRLAVLFGSFARDRARPDSDVDIAVMLEPSVTSEGELALQEAIAKSTGRDVDLVRLESADVILRNRIAREGVLLFEAAPGNFARFQAGAALEYLEMEPLLIDARERFLRRVAR